MDVGVNVSGVHGMVADGKGNTYAFVAPKNKSREPVNEHFYDPKNKITRELLARFNDVNPDKLRQGSLSWGKYGLSRPTHIPLLLNQKFIAK